MKDHFNYYKAIIGVQEKPRAKRGQGQKGRKFPQTTIAVNMESVKELDKYCNMFNMNRKQFVEKAIKFFSKNKIDLNSSDTTFVHDMMENIHVLAVIGERMVSVMKASDELIMKMAAKDVEKYDIKAKSLKWIKENVSDGAAVEYLHALEEEP